MNAATTIANLINNADMADDSLAAAVAAAGEALTLAAIGTHDALSTKATTAKDIAGLLNRGNKDTVARLAIVGQFLKLEGEYTPEGTSVAHVVRTMINAAIKAGNGLPVIRKSIEDSGDQPRAAKALANLAKSAPVATVADEPTDEPTDGDTDTSNELPDFNRYLADAVKLVNKAMECAPVAVHKDDIASLQSLADTVAVALMAITSKVAATV